SAADKLETDESDTRRPTRRTGANKSTRLDITHTSHIFMISFLKNRPPRVAAVLSQGRRISGGNVCKLGLAGRQGLEPRYAAPEAAVLPLDDLPTFPSYHCARAQLGIYAWKGATASL